MFGGSTGGFGIGSTFTTGTGLGTSVGLGGNPLLGGLVWIHSRTEPSISHYQHLRLIITHYLTYYHLNYDLMVKKLL